MHAAPSVILFTVLSGAGFGYLAFLGLGAAASTPGTAFLQFSMGFALAVGGLLASTFHLGNPQRALKAFTQWRTSWLSREAWLSVTALALMGLFAAAIIFFGWRIPALGLLGALLSGATVVATSMIYAQLRTVPRWNSPLTPAYFLLSSLTGGAILSHEGTLSVALLVALAAVQSAAWVAGDGRFVARGHSIASATGLGSMGQLRLFEGPHTGSNYLLNEFVHQVGRKQSRKLRIIAISLIAILPLLALLLLPSTTFTTAMAFLLNTLGLFVSRWLFFSEAEHVVRLYYGTK